MLPPRALPARRLLLLIAVGTNLIAGSPGPPKPRLLFPGENWRSNAPERSGGKWIALRSDPGHSSTEAVTVIVTPTRPNEMRDVVVSIDKGYKPRFMVDSSVGLRPGPAKIYFDGIMPFIPHAIANFRDIGPSQTHAAIMAISRDLKPGKASRKPRTLDIVLVTHPGRVSQTLFSFGESPGQTPCLIWAGDLDHDGRIDLILDVQTGEGAGSMYRLYLSTRAARGSSVGVAATLSDPAC